MAAESTGDAAFGLTAAEVAFPAMFNSLSISMSASDSLLGAFDRFMRFRRIIDSTCINILDETEDGYKFTWVPVPGCESNVGAEAFVAALITLCRWGQGPNFAPLRVTLTHDHSEALGRYQQFFNAPIELKAEENALFFSRESLASPIVTANQPLAMASDQLAADYLARVERADIVDQVHSKLLDFLPQRLFSEEMIAEDLNMSLRSMQRKLSEKGTSYDALFQRVRHDLAIQLMNDPQLSIVDISRYLGFSNRSNFGRAFKRWTGVTPLEFRQSPR
jgi:AraC-like DNA-binding protein